MTPARVGANLLWLVPGVVGGSEDYTVHLLESFARLGVRDLDLTLLVNRSFPDAHPSVVDRFITVVAPVDGTNRPLRVGAEATWLARQARQQGLRFIHHLGGTMPVIRSVPGVVTVHDLQPFTHPQYFHPVKRTYLGFTVPRSVRRAVVVVALSEFTRHDVVRRMGIDPDDIMLVPPGIDPCPPPDEAEIARVRAAYGLGDRPFILYPAITYAHKNHLTLVRAFGRLAVAQPEPMLVLTGGEAGSETALRQEIDALGLGSRIVRAGRVPRPDLDALFDAATALACPSHYEGFGIPVLEAMSHRLPVLASDRTALPEVVGDGGVLLDPDDVEGWAAAMARVVSDPEHRRELAERAGERASHYTWEASAQSLATVHRVALERLSERAPAGPTSSGPTP